MWGMNLGNADVVEEGCLLNELQIQLSIVDAGGNLEGLGCDHPTMLMDDSKGCAVKMHFQEFNRVHLKM